FNSKRNELLRALSDINYFSEDRLEALSIAIEPFPEGEGIEGKDEMEDFSLNFESLEDDLTDQTDDSDATDDVTADSFDDPEVPQSNCSSLLETYFPDSDFELDVTE